MKDRKDINQITRHLGEYITVHKKEIIEEVLSQRTRHITIVLEDIYQSQNASAVFRSAECFGIQDVHLIENENTYSLNTRVLKGANKWLNLVRHKEEENSVQRCFESIKNNGYKILATTPAAKISIAEVDVSEKVAVVMGNELHGLSDYAREHADLKARISMYGFTESLNLSVSAAICMRELVTKIKTSDLPWQLSQDEQNEIRLSWYRKVIKNSALIEKKFLQSIE